MTSKKCYQNLFQRGPLPNSLIRKRGPQVLLCLGPLYTLKRLWIHFHSPHNRRVCLSAAQTKQSIWCIFKSMDMSATWSWSDNSTSQIIGCFVYVGYFCFAFPWPPIRSYFGEESALVFLAVQRNAISKQTTPTLILVHLLNMGFIWFSYLAVRSGQ